MKQTTDSYGMTAEQSRATVARIEAEHCLTCGQADCHCGDFVSSLPPTADMIARADEYDRKMTGDGTGSIFD